MNYKNFLTSGFWADIRYQKLELNPRCERCNSTRDIEVHHKFYRQRWRDVQVSDLETLCHDCHNRHHGGTTLSPKEVKQAAVEEIEKINHTIISRPKTDRTRKKWHTPNHSSNFVRINGRLVYLMFPK